MFRCCFKLFEEKQNKSDPGKNARVYDGKGRNTNIITFIEIEWPNMLSFVYLSFCDFLTEQVANQGRI